MTEGALDDLKKHLLVARDRAEGDVYAFEFEGSFDAPAEPLVVGNNTWRVVYAPSELAIRSALFDKKDGELLAILTPLKRSMIGEDVRVRFADRELLQIDPWESVQMLFAARRIDPRLTHNKALGQALLRCAGDVDFPAVPQATVDEDTAWRTLIACITGLASEPDELGGWVDWALEDPSRLRGLLNDFDQIRGDLQKRIVSRVGDGSTAFFNLLVAASRAGDVPSRRLAVVGLAADVARKAARLSEGDQTRETGKTLRIRLEKYFGDGNAPSEDEMHALGEAVASAMTAVRAVDGVAADLDALLEKEESLEIAHFSPFSRKSWKQRLQRFARMVRDVLDERAESDELQASLDDIHSHMLAGGPNGSAELVRCLTDLARLAVRHRVDELPTGPKSSLGELARDFIEHGSYEDIAREVLTGSDLTPELQEATTFALDAAFRRSDHRNRDFAERLREVLAEARASSDVLFVHEFLDEVLAPLASEQDVLLLVVDGMSWAVARALLQDVGSDYWYGYLPARSGDPLPMFATVPSVTTYSRTSLLTGKLQKGSAHNEKKEFVGHGALQKAIGNKKKVQLFHKGELDAAGRGNVGDAVAAAIADRKNRIVGVVVNTVDDQLSGSDQLSHRWTLDAVTPLRSLLQLADEHDRVVVLTSDHGHVWEQGSERDVDGASDRHRAPTGELIDGELEFSGPMIEELTGMDSVVAAWSERVRYWRGHRGYHGGASLQEVVAPLVVLSAESLETNALDLLPLNWEPPPWWHLQEGIVIPEPVEPVPKDPNRKKPTQQPDEPQLDLLSNISEVISGSWIADLLASDIYQAERDRVHGLTDEDVGRVVAILDANQGRVHLNLLAHGMSTSEGRMARKIAAVKTALNRDGASVIRFDRSDKLVRLDRTLLRHQFGLDD